MPDKTILVVEDDKSIQNFLRISLKANGYGCIIAETGIGGISLFLSNTPDLVLLDLGLPDVDGMEVLGQIRQDSTTPVVIISARGLEKEKVAALDLGADDYITKPFHIEELLARVRVALRHQRPPQEKEAAFVLDGFALDFEKRKVFVNAEQVHLTPLEYKLLVLLVNNSGKVLTHRYIQREVWGHDSADEYQSLRVFMANIRRKIEQNTANPRYITTEVGVGYRFAEE